jgi:hypothetical protein
MRHDCPSEQELLAFHLGMLPEQEVDTVAAHLDCCLGCEAALQKLDGVVDPLLSALRRPVADLALSDTASAANFLDPNHWPRLPGYEVEEVLGQGGKRVVYKARHLALKRTVALKMMLHAGPAGSEARPASGPRRKQWRDCRIPTSCSSSRSARPTASPSVSWSSSRAVR